MRESYDTISERTRTRKLFSFETAELNPKVCKRGVLEPYGQSRETVIQDSAFTGELIRKLWYAES